MENYKSNSHKSRDKIANEKRAEKVISGSVKTKKQSGLRKISDIFIAGDIHSVVSYAISDIVVPSVTKMICDVIKNGADMIFYGEEGRSKHSSVSNRVSYRKYYDQDQERKRYYSYDIGNKFRFDDVILDNRGEAEKVLYAMDEIIDTYGSVRVADLYELVGITGDYTDNDYGWYDIRSAVPVRTGDGWMLKFPRVVPLRK